MHLREVVKIAFVIALSSLFFPVGVCAGDLEEGGGEITVSRYMAYIDAFNRHDLGFVDYYVPDIVFDKDEDGLLRGREEVAQWYADYWKDNNETVIVNSITIDNSKEIIFADITIKLSPKAAPNQERVLDEVIFYELSGGFIRSVRGVYHKERTR
jgi:hypothetical protein